MAHPPHPAPTPAPPKQQPAPPGQTHEVAHGDTLSMLALKYYGNGDEARWRKIYDANKDTIGPDPDYLKPGEKLAIPEP